MNIRKHLHPIHYVEKLAAASYSTLFLVYFVVVMVFGLTYFALSYVGGNNSVSGLKEMEPVYRFLNSLYFSVATATTVGYGDLVPHGFAKFFAALEAMIGFGVFGIFIAKIVSFKDEAALQEVHKLAFESNFYNTSEGFYIIRRDFDGIMHEAEQQGTISARSWENLIVACQKGQSLLEGIPDFYNDNHLYTIDQKREQLLFDAVYRTLVRLEHLLDALGTEEVNIVWNDHPKSREALQGLLAVAGRILHLWENKSPHENAERFESCLAVHASLLQRVDGLR